MTSTLARFGVQAQNPVIELSQPVRHKVNGDRTVVGYLSESNRGAAYLSPRTREKHLYGQFNSDPESYAISKWVIENILVEHDVLAVFIPEKDCDVMYEFEVSQFEEGYHHSFNINFEDDEQVAVPIEYGRKWEADDVTMKL